MNEFFAKLSQDAGVTEIYLVSDGAVAPRSCASRPLSPTRRNVTSAKKDGKQQKFAPSQQGDRAPPSYPTRNSESICRSVNEDEELEQEQEEMETSVALAQSPHSRWHDSSNEDASDVIQSTRTRPGFGTVSKNHHRSVGTTSTPVTTMQPPTAPRRKESIDDSAFDDMSTGSDPRLVELSTSALGMRLAAVQLKDRK